jgi:hypothetical protein
MITIALTLLFGCAGLFALASIALTLHRYGASALRLHQALRACSQERELRFAITELFVAPAQGARILRPDFGARNRDRLAPARLRAAA